MGNSTLDLLTLQDSEQTKNTYFRAPRQSPHIQKIDASTLEVRTVEYSVRIGKLEETILSIIANFKFAPFWLVQQWYDDFYKQPVAFTVVSQWIQVGLVWADTSPMGVFLRPTRFLLDMFKVEDTSFVDIPFALLNHTCGEQQIMFELQMGSPKSELWQIIKMEETLPCYHPLDLSFENESGTIVIREGDFRLGFKRYKQEDILSREDELIRDIQTGKKFTLEFTDFSRFPIVSIKKDTGEIVTQTPDILVPVPRKEGKPQSYAIEIELSPKTLEKYIGIMNNYKDNIKFGKLFYLCSSQRISKLLKDAFKKVGGLGQCELFLLPFVPPAQKLADFSYADEQNQENLLKQTAGATV